MYQDEIQIKYVANSIVKDIKYFFSDKNVCQVEINRLGYMQAICHFYSFKISEIHITGISKIFPWDDSKREQQYKYRCKGIYSSS